MSTISVEKKKLTSTKRFFLANNFFCFRKNLIFALLISTNKNLNKNGLRNFRRLYCLRILYQRMSGWRNCRRWYLCYRRRCLHRLWYLRWCLSFRSNQSGLIKIKPRSFSKAAWNQIMQPFLLAKTILLNLEQILHSPKCKTLNKCRHKNYYFSTIFQVLKFMLYVKLSMPIIKLRIIIIPN
jgi:hypothetical protein